MLTYSKYLVTHKTDTASFTNAVVIASSSRRSLDVFRGIFEEVRKDFLDLKESDVEFRTVRESGWCKGWVAAQFLVPLGTTKDGWSSVEPTVPGALLD